MSKNNTTTTNEITIEINSSSCSTTTEEEEEEEEVKEEEDVEIIGSKEKQKSEILNKISLLNPKPYGIKIMSYNVCCGWSGKDKESKKIYEAIDESDCDVICLQETHSKFQKQIEKRFYYKYPHMIFHNPNKLLRSSGCAVLSKKPMEEVCFSYPKMKNENNKGMKRVKGCFFRQQIVCIKLSNRRRLIICNFHLRPGNSFNKRILSNIKAYLVETNNIRLNEFLWCKKKAEKEIKEKYSTFESDIIYVGDFNEGKHGKTNKYLKTMNYVDAIENEKTWFWPLLIIRISGSYDHIFFDKSRFAKFRHEVMLKYKLISDHTPVKTELMWKWK